MRRQTRQYVAGQFYDYPIDPWQAFSNLGPGKSLRFLADYVRAQLSYRALGRPVRNFEDHIVRHFGETLGRFNMLNYTEKIWGVPARQIHSDWADDRIQGLSVASLVREAAGHLARRAGRGGVKSLARSFYYPRYGTGQIYETIRRRLVAAGSRIDTGSQPLAVHHRAGRIWRVDIAEGGVRQSLFPDHTIQSIPITSFVKLLQPAVPPEILQAALRLRFRSQVCLFITLDRESVTDDQWVYFPETDIPFGRVSEMKNFSRAMSPPGKTSLFVEYFCFAGDDTWRTPTAELLDVTLGHLERLGFIRRCEVRRCYRIAVANVYPVYDIDYRESLGRVLEYLDAFDNLHSIGRPGRFQYTNQDESLKAGIEAAHDVLARERMSPRARASVGA